MKYRIALLLAAIFTFGALTSADAKTIVIGDRHHHHHSHHSRHHR